MAAARVGGRLCSPQVDSGVATAGDCVVGGCSGRGGLLVGAVVGGLLVGAVVLSTTTVQVVPESHRELIECGSSDGFANGGD